jgi:hypothetical protein
MGINRLVLQLLVALGLFVCILTGWYATRTARALMDSPDHPTSTTVAAAPDNRWVILQDAVLDCSTRQTRNRATLVLANDDTGAHPFVAQLVGTRACDAGTKRTIDGAFIGPFTRVFLRERQNFDLPPGGDLRVFSQYQAPRFLRRALGWRLTWFGMSLLLTVLAIWALWTSESSVLAPSSTTKSGRAVGRG